MKTWPWSRGAGQEKRHVEEVALGKVKATTRHWPA